VNQRQFEEQLDVAETSNKGHGRREHRRLEVSTRLVGQLDWPGLEQVCRLTRQIFRHGQWTTEVEYAITSAPRSLAGATQLLGWWRDHWGIENRSHYVRDVTLREDVCRIRRGNAPQNFAALRNAVVSFLRLQGRTNLAAALRDCTWKPQRLFAMLGIFKK
jgi:hypothetical protein